MIVVDQHGAKHELEPQPGKSLMLQLRPLKVGVIRLCNGNAAARVMPTRRVVMTGPRSLRKSATRGFSAMNKAECGSHKSIPSRPRSIFMAWHNLAGPLVKSSRLLTKRRLSRDCSPQVTSSARMSTASPTPLR